MADEPRDNDNADEPRDDETTGEPREDETTGEPRDDETTGEPRDDETTGETREHEDAGEARPRRLTRSRSDTVIGGVAGGLGRYFGIDPILFRIGFVALSFAGGIGIIAYLALLAFVPADDSEAPTRSPWAVIAGALALGLALIIFLGDGPFFFGPGLFFLAVLAVVAVVLWRAIDGGAGGDPARAIGRIALFGLLAFLVICVAIGVGIAAALGGGVVIASLAVVAGLALIATAFFGGGARWLIVPALALVLPLAVVAAADLEFDGGIGDRDYRPATASELRDKYEVGLGELDVDLRDVALPGGRTDLAIDVGIGDAVVWVPDDACITSNVTIGAGASDVLDRDEAGVDLDVEEAATPPAGRPHLHIDADVGIGAIEVVREGFVPDWRDGERGRFRDRWFDDPEGDEVVASREGGLNCA
jgi:phage shock protein PspC (stress-responsive transcriptional regulator)